MMTKLFTKHQYSKTACSRRELKPVLTLDELMTSFFLTLKTVKMRVRAVDEVIFYLFYYDNLFFYSIRSNSIRNDDVDDVGDVYYLIDWAVPAVRSKSNPFFSGIGINIKKT